MPIKAYVFEGFYGDFFIFFLIYEAKLKSSSGVREVMEVCDPRCIPVSDTDLGPGPS